MISERQYQQLLLGHQKGYSLKKKAMKAGVSLNTARKYLKARTSPSSTKKPHTWKTRKDPFGDLWEKEIEPLLRREPKLEAVTIIRFLEDRYPDKVWERHLRTLQRRIKQWRLKYGPEKEVYFPQDRLPGVAMQLDWTHLGELEIMVQDKPYKGLFCHVVFPYSNWQWGSFCRSESLASLRSGLQASLKLMGKVPKELWTDNSSAATHQLHRKGDQRGFNEAYLQICAHFGLEPRTIEVGKPNQNGDVESLNGHFKRRLNQELLLRGHRHFDSEQELHDFIHSVLEALNLKIKEARQVELQTMKILPGSWLNEYSETESHVSRFSTIQVQKVTYSVPNRLIGASLRIRIYENRIEGYFSGEKILDTSKSVEAKIHYSHVIGSLIKKPGAFDRYRWKEQLFPKEIFKTAHERMQREQGLDFANREHLRILKMCVDRDEASIANTLEDLLQDIKTPISSDRIKERLGDYQDLAEQVRAQKVLVPDLSHYDQLLETEVAL